MRTEYKNHIGSHEAPFVVKKIRKQKKAAKNA